STTSVRSRRPTPSTTASCASSSTLGGPTSATTSSRSTSPRIRSCATWCGRLSGRCSPDATWARYSRGAHARRPGRPRRRTACTSSAFGTSRGRAPSSRPVRSRRNRRRLGADHPRLDAPCHADRARTGLHRRRAARERRRARPRARLGGDGGGPGQGARRGGCARAKAAELGRVYRDHKEPLHDTLLGFDGVELTLETLRERGHRLGIVTAKRRSTVDLAFARLPLAHLFEVVVGGDETQRHKPDPEPLLLALARLEADPAQPAYLAHPPYPIPP